MEDKQNATQQKKLKRTKPNSKRRKKPKKVPPMIKFERIFRREIEKLIKREAKKGCKVTPAQIQNLKIQKYHLLRKDMYHGFGDRGLTFDEIKRSKTALRSDLLAIFYGELKKDRSGEIQSEYSATLLKDQLSPPIFYFGKQRSQVEYRVPSVLHFHQNHRVSFRSLVYLHSQKRLFNFRLKKNLLNFSGFKAEKTDLSQKETVKQFKTRVQDLYDNVSVESCETYLSPSVFHTFLSGSLRSEIKVLRNSRAIDKTDEASGSDIGQYLPSNLPSQFEWVIILQENWKVESKDFWTQEVSLCSQSRYREKFDVLKRVSLKFWEHKKTRNFTRENPNF